MSKEKSAYAHAGVNIEAGNQSVALIKSAVTATHNQDVLAGIGSFGGLFSAARLKEMNEPVLVASTDGVGTKVTLSKQTGRFAEVGMDIVNHCVNDILVQGARPMFFLDYFGSSILDPNIVSKVVSGMADACRQSGIALLGGETAEMPGVYSNNQFDVVGTIVGVVERSMILPSKDIEPNDLVIGIASSGPHTNGYSLVRSVFEGISLDYIYPELGEPLLNLLLEPHRNYFPILQAAIKAGILKGLAHITGGGIIDNLPRILPHGCGAQVHKSNWAVPPLFQLIQKLGDITTEEMYHVFNMGIGMAVVIAPEQFDTFKHFVGEQIWIIGKVCEGEGVILD